MKKGFDLYRLSPELKSVLNKLEFDNRISTANKKDILGYIEYNQMNDIGIPRLIRIFYVLRNFAISLNKDFRIATKSDLIKEIQVLKDKDFTPYTISLMKQIIKMFFKYIKNTRKGYPDEVDWISTKIKKADEKKISPSELITEDDIKKAIEFVYCPRDKALISMLYETGARIGEIGSLQIKNVKIDQHGALLDIEGKTGKRTVRIISSVPYLVVWLQNHPFKTNQESPLWVSLRAKITSKAMSYDGLREIIRRAFKRSKIPKKCNPHIFRHSRASFLADHLTEFQMNQYFGWIQGSGMPSTYVHMSGKQLDNSLLELHGVKNDTIKKESVLTPITCQRCKTSNPHDSKYCRKCASFLDMKTALEYEEKLRARNAERNEYDGIMNAMLKDPEVIELFKRKMPSIINTN